MPKTKRASSNDWPTIARTMLSDAGLSYREASERIGMGESYVGGVLHNMENGSEPNVWTVAALAEACGYQLRLVGHDRDIRIRP